MFISKQRQRREQSPISTSALSNKLFVDYPYPVIAELRKTCKQNKKSGHSHRLGSLQWYRHNIHKLFRTPHHSHEHQTSIALTKQSSRRVHTDERSSEAMAENVQKTGKCTHIKGRLAGSMTPPSSEEEEQHQNNPKYLRTRYMSNFPHRIHDDRG